MKYLFLMIIVFMLSGCKVEETKQAPIDGPINIVATTTHARDIIEQVGGEYVVVEGVMGPGVDPHDYQPAASDIEKLYSSDAAVYSGLHLEAMFTTVFEEMDRIDKPTLELAQALTDEDLLLSDEGNEEYDPHIWFSIDNWLKVTDDVAAFLGEIDPTHQEVFNENAKNYKAELNELSDYVEQRIDEVPAESRYLITAHDAFQYFADDFDFEVVGIQGLNTQSEAGTRDISRLADFIAEKEINAVFVESSVSTRNMEALMEAVRSRGHDIDLGGELYSDSLGSKADTSTYIGMYKANVDTIVDGLTKGE